ncbi:HNH endonuclease [Frateuria sp. GZRR33]|uniref:HNH endonuclease n=1 Tax=Frateuria sp. GZRR33 TaxID=3351535 RepID=UPI003EDBE426
MEQVTSFPWDEIANPFLYAASGDTEEDLAERLVANPLQSEDVYALVRVRGPAQSIFRKALLRAYDYRCAICGLSFQDALEAAHLIPWPQATPAQRMSPTNGVLLCSIHHRLFDHGMITIGPNWTVRYFDPRGREGPYSAIDEQVSTTLHGKPAIMPADPRHHPAPEALAHHYKRFEWSFDGDVPPPLSSTPVWSPIPHPKEIGREETLFRRADHRLPA